jgi:hypothetical protein
VAPPVVLGATVGWIASLKGSSVPSLVASVNEALLALPSGSQLAGRVLKPSFDGRKSCQSDDCVEQAGESLLEFRPAQPYEGAVAGVALQDEPGLAQYSPMVGLG